MRRRDLDVCLVVLALGCAEVGRTPVAGSGARQAPATNVCDPRQFGAKADGVTADTRALQAAIDACAGGGEVVLSGGTFLSGMVTLRSHLTFTIDGTATLRGTQNDADYPDVNPPTDNSQLSNCRKSLIYAEGVDSITLRGGGTIDGNGDKPDWRGGPPAHPERTRPMVIFTTLSSNIAIEDLHVENAAMWAVVNMEADHLVIRNLDVHSDLSGTRDGIDIVDCHDVLVENVTVFSEDDAICLKSGSRRGTEGVIVRNSKVLRSIVANGLKLGTASTGSFKDITFEDITLANTDKAAMAVESVDGADIANVTFQRIQFAGAGTPVFVILGRRGTPARVGSIDGVTFEDITGTAPKHAWGMPISGTIVDGVRYAPRNLRFVGVRVDLAGGVSPMPVDPPEYDGRYPDPNLWGNLPAAGYYMRHVDGVTITGGGVTIGPGDARPAQVTRDVTGLSQVP
jgi:polygalacturonase